jgi:uncharacterized protein
MATTLSKEVRNWAMWCHLASLVQFITLIPVPFVGLIAPIVVWLLKKDDHEFIDRHGKESINFQLFIVIITFIIPFVVILFILALFVVISLVGIALTESPFLTILAFFPIYMPILIGLYLLLWTCACIFVFIATLVAANRASNGDVYRYPFAWQILK